jgi:hypothetical protein
MNAKVLFAASFALASFSSVSGAISPDDSELLRAGWLQTNPGVYTLTDGDVSYRLSMGTEGARYEKQLLTAHYSDLLQRKSSSKSSNIDSELADIVDALAVIPDKADGAVRPFTATTGSLCGSFNYGLDSHFVVGSVGATAISRVNIGELNFGPPVVPTAAASHNSATVTPESGAGSVVTSSHSTSIWGDQAPSAVAAWQLPLATWDDQGNIIAANCTASTLSSVSITASGCSGGTGFMSLSKTYSTCVSSP